MLLELETREVVKNTMLFKFSLTNFLYIYKPKRKDMFFIVFVAVGVYLLRDLLIKQ
jgi:hypothetical protein